MAEFNKMPHNAEEIQAEKVYAELQDFFTFTHREESRTVFYDEDNIKAGLADVRIW